MLETSEGEYLIEHMGIRRAVRGYPFTKDLVKRKQAE